MSNNLNLKSIFTSGDSYTVLQLLDKLIKAVEGDAQIYVHTVTMTGGVTSTFLSLDSTPWTWPISGFISDTVTTL